MKVVVAGSRSITDYYAVLRAIQRSGFKITEVVSGGARGVDRLGERFARENGIALKIMRADWDRHGKRAGYLRNKDMVDYADAVIVVWDGKSPGSRHTINLAANKPHYIVSVESK